MHSDRRTLAGRAAAPRGNRVQVRWRWIIGCWSSWTRLPGTGRPAAWR